MSPEPSTARIVAPNSRQSIIDVTPRPESSADLDILPEGFSGPDAYEPGRIGNSHLDALLGHTRTSHEVEQQLHIDTIAALRREYDRTRRYSARHPPQQEYYARRVRQQARELKQRQTEIALRIEQHQQRDGHFHATLESLVSLFSRAAELFDCSKIEQKRELIAFVFSNLRLRGKTLEFSLRSPFDLMVSLQDHSGWLPFLSRYRTICIAPNQEMRLIFEELRGLRGSLPALT
jgi:hypothetical protein